MEKVIISKTMHITLWVVQVLLAALFLLSGFMKAATPIEELSARLPWATTVPAALVRFIGLSEMFGALGLVLPSLLRRKPALTAWAGLGLATVMLLAIPFHISRGETPITGLNVTFMLLALFVAWGRWKKAPIRAK